MPIDCELPEFQPHRLIRGGHAQTIAGVYLPGRRAPYRAKQHVVELPDGDRLALHDDTPDGWRPGQRVALLIHGLGGCHGSPYMVRVTEKLLARGVRVFRLDLRGWGAGATFAAAPFHAARTGDIEAAIDAVRAAAPQSPLAAVGFSLGANMLLKLLGDLGDAPPPDVDRAMAVAPPIDLMHCCKNLERGFQRVYDRKYAGYLWRHLHERATVAPQFAAAAREKPPRSIYEFDWRFTAPMGGFESVEHYYAAASSKPVLAAVRVPTLILSAYDDPIVPGRVFDDAVFAPATRLRLTAHGGHLGFIARAGGDADRRWMDWRVVDFVTAGQRD